MSTDGQAVKRQQRNGDDEQRQGHTVSREISFDEGMSDLRP